MVFRENKITEFNSNSMASLLADRFWKAMLFVLEDSEKITEEHRMAIAYTCEVIANLFAVQSAVDDDLRKALWKSLEESK